MISAVFMITLACLGSAQQVPRFPADHEVESFYRGRTEREIRQAVDSLFATVSGKQGIVRSIRFLIDSDTAARHAMDAWVELILREHEAFRVAYGELEGFSKTYVDGLWRELIATQVDRLQNEFISICGFFGGVELEDAFAYDKQQALKHATNYLQRQGMVLGKVVCNVGITSRDCEDRPVDIVFVAFHKPGSEGYADITIEYAEGEFGEIIEYSSGNLWCPKAMIRMKREFYADSGCE